MIKMSEELEGLRNRISGNEYETQTLKEKVDYLQKEVKKLKNKEFEEFIKHSDCNLPKEV